MTNQIIENYLAQAIASFRSYKKLADKSIAQVSDEEFFALIDVQANSMAVIVKHIAGNQLSRWADFLTSDGEKETRRRDREFELSGETREILLDWWERGWQTLFAAIEPLTVPDFAKIVTIRGQPHTICEAINRQLTHYAYHIGQIVLLAKHFRSSEWRSLSVPKNKSDQFNNYMQEQVENVTAGKRSQRELAQDFVDILVKNQVE